MSTRANEVVSGLMLEPGTEAVLVVIVRAGRVHEYDFATHTDRALPELAGIGRLACTHLDLKLLRVPLARKETP